MIRIDRTICPCGNVSWPKIYLGPNDTISQECSCGVSWEINGDGSLKSWSPMVASIPAVEFTTEKGLREEKRLPELPKDIVASPIEAYRLWRVLLRPVGTVAGRYDDGDDMPPIDDPNAIMDYRLGSVGIGAYEWNRIEHAVHEDTGWGNDPADHHLAPQEDCHCGIWAFKDVDHLWPHVRRYSFDQTPLWAYGKVEMWGRLIETENGWRAEYARPKEVVLVLNAAAQRLDEIDHTRADEVELVREASNALRSFYRCPVLVRELRGVPVDRDREDRGMFQLNAASAFQAIGRPLAPWTPKQIQAAHQFNTSLKNVSTLLAMPMPWVERRCSWKQRISVAAVYAAAALAMYRAVTDSSAFTISLAAVWVPAALLLHFLAWVDPRGKPKP